MNIFTFAFILLAVYLVYYLKVNDPKFLEKKRKTMEEEVKKEFADKYGEEKLKEFEDAKERYSKRFGHRQLIRLMIVNDYNEDDEETINKLIEDDHFMLRYMQKKTNKKIKSQEEDKKYLEKINRLISTINEKLKQEEKL